ncbi:MAG: PAS domain S-box protein [Spirochaetes bacterium]|nr:MAG: PAS domain S-box protein [Spirochaetota bacterium]
MSSDSLLQNEDTFRSIISNVSEYIYSVRMRDEESVRSYHSPQSARVTGYSPEELGSNPYLWYLMIHAEDRARVSAFLAAVRNSGASSSIEHRIVRKDGSVRWVSNTCTASGGDQPGEYRMDGFLVDITAQKERELTLRKLSRAIEQSPSTVVITDKHGTIEYVNPKFTKLTGYTLDEAVGKNPRILKSGTQDAPFYRDLWQTILAGNEWRGEFHNRKKNGELYWESASISPIREGNGEITHFVAVKEDVTARKAAEDALRVSEGKLRERSDAVEKDMKLAQLTQRALIHKQLPESTRFQVEYRYIPLDTVGGDYFTVLPYGDLELGVFIGDVSGHGIAAALFVSLVKFTTDRIFRKHAFSPAEYIKQLNIQLKDYMSSYFLTGIYGLFSFLTDGSARFTFCNGGHPYPVLLRADGSAELFDSRGTIIGAFEQAVYEEKTMVLGKGDRLLLYTDGISETENERKEMLGFEEGLVKLFHESRRETLSATLDTIIEAVNAFRGSARINDDVVLLGFEIL